MDPLKVQNITEPQQLLQHLLWQYLESFSNPWHPLAFFCQLLKIYETLWLNLAFFGTFWHLFGNYGQLLTTFANLS